MYIFICWIFLLSYGFADELKPRAVNLELETVLQFDKKNKPNDIKFLDQVQGFIEKLKGAIDDKPEEHVGGRRHMEISNDLKFSDFLKNAIFILKTYSNKDLESFFDILDEELRKYHYDGCKFYELLEGNNVRQYISHELDKFRSRPAKKIRHKLSDVVRQVNEPDIFNMLFLNYMNSIYINKEPKFQKVLNNMEEFKNKTNRSSIDLRRIVSKGLRSILFEHYSNLSPDVRSDIKTKLDYFLSKVNITFGKDPIRNIRSKIHVNRPIKKKALSSQVMTSHIPFTTEFYAKTFQRTLKVSDNTQNIKETGISLVQKITDAISHSFDFNILKNAKHKIKQTPIHSTEIHKKKTEPKTMHSNKQYPLKREHLHSRYLNNAKKHTVSRDQHHFNKNNSRLDKHIHFQNRPRTFDKTRYNISKENREDTKQRITEHFNRYKPKHVPKRDHSAHLLSKKSFITLYPKNIRVSLHRRSTTTATRKINKMHEIEKPEIFKADINFDNGVKIPGKTKLKKASVLVEIKRPQKRKIKYNLRDLEGAKFSINRSKNKKLKRRTLISEQSNSRDTDTSSAEIRTSKKIVKYYETSQHSYEPQRSVSYERQRSISYERQRSISNEEHRHHSADYEKRHNLNEFKEKRNSYASSEGLSREDRYLSKENIHKRIPFDDLTRTHLKHRRYDVSSQMTNDDGISIDKENYRSSSRYRTKGVENISTPATHKFTIKQLLKLVSSPDKTTPDRQKYVQIIENIEKQLEKVKEQVGWAVTHQNTTDDNVNSAATEIPSIVLRQQSVATVYENKDVTTEFARHERKHSKKNTNNSSLAKGVTSHNTYRKGDKKSATRRTELTTKTPVYITETIDAARTLETSEVTFETLKYWEGTPKKLNSSNLATKSVPSKVTKYIETIQFSPVFRAKNEYQEPINKMAPEFVDLLTSSTDLNHINDGEESLKVSSSKVSNISTIPKKITSYTKVTIAIPYTSMSTKGINIISSVSNPAPTSSQTSPKIVAVTASTTRHTEKSTTVVSTTETTASSTHTTVTNTAKTTTKAVTKPATTKEIKSTTKISLQTKELSSPTRVEATNSTTPVLKNKDISQNLLKVEELDDFVNQTIMETGGNELNNDPKRRAIQDQMFNDLKMVFEPIVSSTPFTTSFTDSLKSLDDAIDLL